MCRITIVHSIRQRLSSASLVKRLVIEPFGTCYNRQLLRWTCHVAQMPLIRAPRKVFSCWVDNVKSSGFLIVDDDDPRRLESPSS
jgi:hypothetical protein